MNTKTELGVLHLMAQRDNANQRAINALIERDMLAAHVRDLESMIRTLEKKVTWYEDRAYENSKAKQYEPN